MNPSPETPKNSKSSSKKFWRFPRVAALSAAVVLGAGVVATQTFAGGWGGHGGWRHGGFVSAQMTPERAEKRIKKMVRHLAIEVDATLEQQDKMIKIFSSAARDLLPLRAEIKSSRKAAKSLLTQATIDRAAIEAHRSTQIERMEKASKRMATALADAAEVLTPEQRAKLAELMPW